MSKVRKISMSLIALMLSLITLIPISSLPAEAASVSYRSAMNLSLGNNPISTVSKTGSCYVWISSKSNLKCGKTTSGAKVFAKNVNGAVTNGTYIFYSVYSYSSGSAATTIYRKKCSGGSAVKISKFNSLCRLVGYYNNYFYIIKENEWPDYGLYKVKKGSTSMKRVAASAGSIDNASSYGKYIALKGFASDVSNKAMYLYNVSSGKLKKITGTCYSVPVIRGSKIYYSIVTSTVYPFSTKSMVYNISTGKFSSN